MRTEKPKTRAGSKARSGSSRSVHKHPTSYKLTETALDIVTALSANRGIAKSALIENLVREAWQAETGARKA